MCTVVVVLGAMGIVQLCQCEARWRLAGSGEAWGGPPPHKLYQVMAGSRGVTARPLNRGRGEAGRRAPGAGRLSARAAPAGSPEPAPMCPPRAHPLPASRQASGANHLITGKGHDTLHYNKLTTLMDNNVMFLS